MQAKKGTRTRINCRRTSFGGTKKKVSRRTSEKREEDLDKANDEGKYYLNLEDIYKHPCITWENESGPEDFRLVKSFVQGVDKKGG